MKKILALLLLFLLLVCCRNEGVYHTYYGDINIDTMTAYYDKGFVCYIVNVKSVDSLQAKALGADTLYWVIYYKPSDNTYLIQVVDNYGGGGMKVEFDPLIEDSKL